MTRIVGPPGSRRRRRFLAIPVLLTMMVGLLFIGTAGAVHDIDFQLDGDVVTSPDGNVGGGTQEFDWQDFFDANGDELTPLPAGFDASVFNRDFQLNTNGTFNTQDTTTWATGSKDIYNPNGGGAAGASGNWQCKRDMNLLDKNDIMNSYAASYAPAGGDEILYFGLERNGNEGAANVGFWFLQDPTIACNAPGGGNFQFTGNHEDGDLLVVSQFTNGGTVSTIEVFEWQGGANGCIDDPDTAGACDGLPIASGADCRAPGTPLGDEACAAVNAGTIAITPWTTVEKTTVGHSLFANEFFEGGINLTDTGLGGKCFNTFLANTRASQELGANLHDFSVGSLGGCTANVTTTPKDGAGNNIPAGGLSIGTGSVEVKDSATIEVTGATVWEGSLQFSLCGPIAAPATCATNGVEIGAAIDVSNTTTQPILSDAATVTSAGRYCWRADFTSETDGVPDDSDSSLGECFIVNPVTPTLTTTAGPDVLLGQPITDTANLTGTANRPGTPVINPTTPGGPAGGSITFSLFGPSDTGCGPLVATLSPATPVSGDGTYGPVSFTPTEVGTYHWVASYSGDPPNTNADDHNLDCSDPTEDVEVISVPSSLFSRQSFIPNDSATVSATQGGNLAGTVSFAVFESSDCSGTAIYSQNVPVSGGSPQTVSTTNTTVSTTAANVSWLISYDSTNPAQRDIPANCLEKTALAIDNGGTISSPPIP